MTVKYKSYTARNVSSTPEIIFVSQYDCEVVCIHICNKTNNPLFLDIKLLQEIETVGVDTYFCNKIPIAAYGKQEMINVSFNETIKNTPSTLYVPSGEILFANSDFVENKFDSIVVYREFIE